MHPVLSNALKSFTDELALASLEDLQVSPGLGMQRWCGQQVVEHLLMMIERSRLELKKRIDKPRLPLAPRTHLQWVIKAQLFWFGFMPRGLLAPRSLRPREWVPESGALLAQRLTKACSELDDLLHTGRRMFGMEPCGEHHIYGALRVEEWRAYHARHIRHHLPQLKAALEYSRSTLHLVEFNARPVEISTSRARWFAIRR